VHWKRREKKEEREEEKNCGGGSFEVQRKNHSKNDGGT